MDRSFQPARVRMPNARQGRMNGTDHELEPAPLQFQHFHVAERLRKHGVAGIEVTEAQSVERLSG